MRNDLALCQDGMGFGLDVNPSKISTKTLHDRCHRHRLSSPIYLLVRFVLFLWIFAPVWVQMRAGGIASDREPPGACKITDLGEETRIDPTRRQS